ncbi:Hypothetical predicted protein [Lynx pardinus]|uniref:Uncharacterized protein n=1 Tax=Lynx pardinus TaxID=191816 RepID=A0A485NC03_LYNPA|nr:Hypothetical predicted protein [Lynx pardinus]
MAPKRAKASSGPLGPLQKESLQVSASSGEMQVRPQNCTVRQRRPQVQRPQPRRHREKAQRRLMSTTPGTTSSLNLVLIPTWVLLERPEECNPAHTVAARWSARNQRNVEKGQPPSSWLHCLLLQQVHCCFDPEELAASGRGIWEALASDRGGCCWALTAFQKTKLGSPTRITLSPFLGLGVLLIKRACGPRKSWPDWLTPASCTVLLPLTSSPPTGQTTPALGHQLGGPTERKLSQARPRPVWSWGRTVMCIVIL